MAGWTLRKSKSMLGGLVRVTITRRGLSVSVGVPGFRLSFGADGKRRRTVSLPGTGLRKTDVLGRR